jgi:DNA-binding response OmpR family regulator
MFTGRTSVEDVKTARDIGVNEFIAKPFTAAELSKRMLLAIQHPRQFMVSSHYIGPDRRRKITLPPMAKRSAQRIKWLKNYAHLRF